MLQGPDAQKCLTNKSGSRRYFDTYDEGVSAEIEHFNSMRKGGMLTAMDENL